MPNYEYYWTWGCCNCSLQGGMTTNIDYCPGYNCGHTRCDECPLELAKIPYGRGGGMGQGQQTSHNLAEQNINSSSKETTSPEMTPTMNINNSRNSFQPQRGYVDLNLSDLR